MDKIGYLYDAMTKIFAGSVGIQESPLEPGVWLMPPNCTLDAPLAPQEGKDVAYIGSVWQYITPPPDGSPQQPVEDIRQTMIVSRFQARAALLNAGLLDQVDAYFNSSTPSAIDRLAWQQVNDFYRLSPLVISVGASLSLNDDQLDQLFRAAAAISV